MRAARAAAIEVGAVAHRWNHSTTCGLHA